MTADVGVRPFEHIGFLYAGYRQYAAACANFLRRGLSAGDPVMVAVPAANLTVISAAMGADADRVRFEDMATLGRNPGRIIPWVLLDFAAAHPGRRVWIIGEPIWPGRTAVEYPACAAHEALINTAFAGRNAAIFCPYDAANLDPTAVSDARRTHPLIAEGSGAPTSTPALDAIDVAASFNLPLPAVPADAARYPYRGVSDLAGLRAAATHAATAAGLDAGRSNDLALAVDELAANTIEHTASGYGMLSIWAEPGLLVCQIDDGGHLRDPMAGRILPTAQEVGGRGLALVNNLVDLVRTYSHLAGTSMRIHMHLPTYASC